MPASAQRDAAPPPDDLDEDTLVVIVDDMEPVRRTVGRMLSKDGYQVETFPSGEALLASLARLLPSAIYLDLDLPGIGGLQTLERIRAKSPNVPVVMLTGDDSVETVVKAMKRGAYDYVVKPPSCQKILAVARNAVERYRMTLRLTSLEREATGRGYPEIIGTSEPMLKVFRQMDRVAASDITLLIHGESGTGKELVARAIHAASSRERSAFVAVNCAAIPESLQESELFGHEKGAFTGATDSRVGKFEMADRGTVFLDEVAELSLNLQAKLLRVLQDSTFYRVGGSREIRSDFRLITATHRNLAEDVSAGLFREDLYFRIVVCELELPPLRERPGEVQALTETFLRQYAHRHGGHVSIAPRALELLQRYRWPGNVRELNNVLQRALVFCESGMIEPKYLPARLLEDAPLAPDPIGANGNTVHGEGDGDGHGDVEAGARDGDVSPTLNLDTIERDAIGLAMKRANGNITKVARLLGVSRATLYRKLARYGLR